MSRAQAEVGAGVEAGAARAGAENRAGVGNRVGAEERAGGGKALAAWEIVSIVSSVLIAAWIVPALTADSRRYALIPSALALGYIVASVVVRGESARELGIRFDNFWRALRLLVPPMLLAAVFLAVVGWFGGSTNVRRWGGGRGIVGVAALGVGWGLLQQFALQCFVNRRAQELFGPGWKSVLLVASIFGLLHLPNPALTAATFVAGLLWAWAFQRVPNVFALALSHGLMTWALISTAPPGLLNNLRVGYKFFGLFI